MIREKSQGEAIGVVTIGGVAAEFSNHTVSIVFYTDDTYTVPVDQAAMSGTVTFTASETGEDFSYGDIDNGVLTLGVVTKYDRPFAALASLTSFKIDFAGITGASHYRVIISSGGAK